MRKQMSIYRYYISALHGLNGYRRGKVHIQLGKHQNSHDVPLFISDDFSNRLWKYSSAIIERFLIISNWLCKKLYLNKVHATVR